MKTALAWLLLAVIALTNSSLRAAPGPHEPAPSTRTFYIEGVKSDKDVDAIKASVMKVTSVTNVTGFTPVSGYANISFDHHAVTHQQIAQAIMDTGDFHVTFKFTVPDYPKNENAAKMDKIFASVSDLVKIEPIDRDKGTFVIRFLPFKPDPKKPRGMGFNFGHIAHPIIDPPPKGMGLKIQQAAEGKPAPAAAKKKAKP